jgi:hypothetical protein
MTPLLRVLLICVGLVTIITGIVLLYVGIFVLGSWVAVVFAVSVIASGVFNLLVRRG